MEPFILILILLTFAAAFLGVTAISAVLADVSTVRPLQVRERINEEIRTRQQASIRKELVLRDLKRISSDDSMENGGKTSVVESLRFTIEQSGLNLTLRRLAVLSLLAGSTTGLAAGAVTGSPLVVLALAIIGSIGPTLYVRWVRGRRLEKLRSQLPDAFDLMSRVLRAGQTMSQALQSVADEFDAPISHEFGYCYEQMNLGLHPETALRDLARRTAVVEIRIFVLAVIVHRQTGGNLAELLEKLATVVRERFRIRGLIDSLTAQGRLQASILLGLPLFMFVLLMVLRPEYELKLFEYPWLIAGGLTAMACGAIWIRRIVSFDF